MSLFGRTRSVLFVPATRPDLVEKIGQSGADIVVLDLEDTVPPPAKDDARSAVPGLVAVLKATAGATVLLRVNDLQTPWCAADLELAGRDGLAGIVVPKVASAGDLDEIGKHADVPVVAGIENAVGVAAVETIAPRVAALYFGAEDFVADMRGRRTPGSAEVLYARSRVALAARVADVPAFDQVFFDVADEDGFRRDAEAGRDLGFAGKMCLNPRQVRWANEVWTPTADEVDWATRALAAYDEAAAAGEGVAFVDGRLIDLPAVRLARHVIDQRGA